MAINYSICVAQTKRHPVTIKTGRQGRGSLLRTLILRELQLLLQKQISLEFRNGTGGIKQ